MATILPTVSAVLIKEKSFLEIKTTADKATNNASVTRNACSKNSSTAAVHHSDIE